MTMPLSISRDDLLPGRNDIGRWCDAEEGRRFDVTDPATDAVVAAVPDSGAPDARAALALAAEAVCQGNLR
jgi:succinate-semialdehyde dehydrogenase/glutarate-semialdehyde dehydrogenase